jgi:fatty-acyl-CoA synthase
MGRADFGRDVMASADRIGGHAVSHPSRRLRDHQLHRRHDRQVQGAIRRHRSTAAMSVAVSADFEFPAVPRYLAAAPSPCRRHQGRARALRGNGAMP